MTQTDACNAALGHLGSFTVASIDENSAEARQCKRFFTETRQSLIRSYDWNFSTDEATLSEIDGAAKFGYDHAYALPSDYLRALAFDGVKAGTKQQTFKLANNRLYSDTAAENAKLEYVKDVTDVTQWDADFYTAFGWFLAAAIAPSITQKPETAMTMLQGAAEFLKEAKGIDTVEDGLRVLRGIEHSRYQQARAGLSAGAIGGNWPGWMFQDFGPPGHSES